jgi:predicted nucleic acid-binding protein
MYSSRVALVEVTKAVARHDPEADPTAVLGRVSWVELDEDIAGVASSTGGPRLRALDAIHVASALRVAPEIEAFVTYDARQAAAAEAAGLRVLTPSDDPEPPLDTSR